MKNKKRILIGVNSDLITDVRVHKVCTSLAQAGYALSLIGRKWKESTDLHRPYPTRRVTLRIRKGPLFYVEFNIRLALALLFSRGDAILCNDTDALLACFWVSKLKRIPLIFDAHELFPELPEVVNRPRIKEFWQGLEDSIFPQLQHAYTVCQSIAEYYLERYGLQMGVVRNIPLRESGHEPISPIPLHRKEAHILLYQGAVNIGRGVDWLIEAMPFLPDCCLVICGEGDCSQAMHELAARSEAHERIVFTGRIPQEELKRYTIQADVGFVLLEHMGLSYYYALPNRIFDYMRVGVPVLATRFPEIARVVEEAESGTLLTHYEPEYLAQQIHLLLAQWESPERRKQLKETARQYSWEEEEKVLLSIVQNALSKDSLKRMSVQKGDRLKETK